MTNSQAGHLYIQMLFSAKPALRPVLRNRLVGDIPNPRMIANFVVRRSVVSLLLSQPRIIKKQGKADPESIHFCPALSSLRLQFFPLLSGSFPFLLQIIAIELLHDLSGHQNRSSQERMKLFRYWDRATRSRKRSIKKRGSEFALLCCRLRKGF